MQATALSGLPDPEYDAAFYEGVPVKRLIAWVIDAVIIGILTAIVVLFTAFIGLFFLPAVILFVSFVYRSLTVAAHSATWGMVLAAVEIRTHRGERLDPLTAILHTGLYLAIFSTMLPLVISAATMLGTPRKQGLHDLLLGTAVINRAAAS